MHCLEHRYCWKLFQVPGRSQQSFLFFCKIFEVVERECFHCTGNIRGYSQGEWKAPSLSGVIKYKPNVLPTGRALLASWAANASLMYCYSHKGNVLNLSMLYNHLAVIEIALIKKNKISSLERFLRGTIPKGWWYQSLFQRESFSLRDNM